VSDAAPTAIYVHEHPEHDRGDNDVQAEEAADAIVEKLLDEQA
jgi:hypothetical protein